MKLIFFLFRFFFQLAILGLFFFLILTYGESKRHQLIIGQNFLPCPNHSYANCIGWWETSKFPKTNQKVLILALNFDSKEPFLFESFGKFDSSTWSIENREVKNYTVLGWQEYDVLPKRQSLVKKNERFI